MAKRILTDGKGGSVETPYTDDDAIQRLELLLRKEGDNFPRDLCEKGRKWGLTDRQAYWVHKILLEREQPRTSTTPNYPGVGVKMIAMFDRAAQHLKWPKVRFQDVHFVRAGAKSSYPGSINVVSTHRDREQRSFYGRILRDGTFCKMSQCTPEILRRVLEICADPAELAGIQGRQVGSCCFCSRALTDERSTSVGYGPICAARFGLPWGEVEEKPACDPETCVSDRCLETGHDWTQVGLNAADYELPF